jgi:hypothetical protein
LHTNISYTAVTVYIKPSFSEIDEPSPLQRLRQLTLNLFTHYYLPARTLSTMEDLPPDFWVTSTQFTPKTYQTNYPAIDPTNPQNSLAGKVVIISGASRGIGAMVRTGKLPTTSRNSHDPSCNEANEAGRG